MNAQLALRDGVGFGFVGDSAVFLDLEADAYFRADSDTSRALKLKIEGRSCDVISKALEGLVRRGQLTRGASSGSTLAATIIPTPENDLDGWQPERNRAIRKLGAIVHLIVVGLRLRFGSLNQEIARIRKLKSAAIAVSKTVDGFEGLAWDYNFAERIVPLSDRCIQRSIAITEALLKAGYDPILVFGVRLDPVCAHCWVQVQKQVLSDRCGVVRSFTPIMAI